MGNVQLAKLQAWQLKFAISQMVNVESRRVLEAVCLRHTRDRQRKAPSDFNINLRLPVCSTHARLASYRPLGQGEERHEAAESEVTRPYRYLRHRPFGDGPDEKGSL